MNNCRLYGIICADIEKSANIRYDETISVFVN